MDDAFCGHPISFQETFFGRNLNYARRKGNFCGPDGNLFEEAEMLEDKGKISSNRSFDNLIVD